MLATAEMAEDSAAVSQVDAALNVYDEAQETLMVVEDQMEERQN